MLKKLMLAAAIGALALSAQAQTVQQNKMKNCDAEAKDKTGDARKDFMKTCLSAKKDGRAAQQEKMKSCNASATGKAGDARKAHMKECLSKPA
jgi:psiF repeat